MKEALQDVPSSLEDVFQTLLDDDRSEKEEILLMFQWLLFAKRPLKPEELYFAVRTGTTARSLGDWNRLHPSEGDIYRHITHVSRGLIGVRRTDKMSNEVDLLHGYGFYGSALQAAIGQGKEAIVELLLDQGIDVNASSEYLGNTLQAASAYGHEAIVRVLLENGADPNLVGGDYGNALQASILEGNIAVVEILLETGANVNAQGGFFGCQGKQGSGPQSESISIQHVETEIYHPTHVPNHLLNMHALISLAVFGAFVGACNAQSFEPADFDVSTALLNLGVNVADYSELSEFLGKRSAASCSAVCQVLTALDGEEALYTPDEIDYEFFNEAYWARQQARVTPQCIYKPATTTDIQIFILLARLTQCSFAVVSGGNAAFQGASNIENGITVSLENFTGVELSNDKKTVNIQTGNNWGDVYAILDAQDVTVSGGRVSRVGTGGYTLGGGISYFANEHGWALDNVVSYEVITASGVKINATPQDNEDLYWALRGGGNNFGIVIAFTFETISLPGGLLWGGSRSFLEPSFDALDLAFADIITNSADDPKAGASIAWIPGTSDNIASLQLWYSEPDAGAVPIFNGFNAITPVASSTSNRVLHQLTSGSSNPAGFRRLHYTITVKADIAILKIARDIFYEEFFGNNIEGVIGISPRLIQEGITEGQLSHMTKNGGNPLGLSPTDGPLYLFYVDARWENANEDATVYSFASTVIERIAAEAETLGLESEYLYMNFASAFENVIASYGPDNVDQLKAVAEYYDPTAVFQVLQPGHFKLDRAPVPSSGYFSG
ncbi:Bifunctional solanapyrone synthase [Paramyrothecium foliicola]|nr:Bifunctional solanapyrone synthase [Paramyrothecium foliicola]